METGFWRPKPDNKLEVVLAHPTGFAEIWYGEIDGAKIEMRTDVVARTATAKEVAAGHRLYGLVKGELHVGLRHGRRRPAPPAPPLGHPRPRLSQLSDTQEYSTFGRPLRPS